MLHWKILFSVLYLVHCCIHFHACPIYNLQSMYVHAICAELAEMTKLFVEALNSPGGVPAIGSTWDRVLEVTYESAMKGAMQCYAEKMSSLYMPSESTDLLKHHGQAWDKALCKFREALNMDTDEACYEKYLRQLQVSAQQCIYFAKGEVYSWSHSALEMHVEYICVCKKT